jgi:hypothetical protein
MWILRWISVALERFTEVEEVHCGHRVPEQDFPWWVSKAATDIQRQSRHLNLAISIDGNRFMIEKFVNMNHILVND